MQTGQTNREQFELMKRNSELEQEAWNQAKREFAYENVHPVSWTVAMTNHIAGRAQEIKRERIAKGEWK